MWGKKGRESWLVSESFGGIKTKQKRDWSRFYFAYFLSLLLELLKLLELFLQISLPRNVHFTFPLILLNSMLHCVWIIWLEQIWWIWFNNPSFWITAFLGPWKKEEICHVLCQRVAEHRRHQLHLVWTSLNLLLSAMDQLWEAGRGERKVVTVWEPKRSVFRCWGSKTKFFGVGVGSVCSLVVDGVMESHRSVTSSGALLCWSLCLCWSRVSIFLADMLRWHQVTETVLILVPLWTGSLSMARQGRSWE